MMHNQQVPEISRTYLVIAPEKSPPYVPIAKETSRIIQISGTCHHLIRQTNVKHQLLKYIVFEKMPTQKQRF